jgi:general secretion pathway protein A
MYLEHFGFLESPFNLTPDPEFIYSNRAYQEAFTGVRWGIKLRQGLMVVTGERGTGKTTLLRLIGNKLESDVHTAVISSCVGDFTELLRQLLDQLGRRPVETERCALMERVRNYLTEQFDRNHIVAVLIDEAEDLPATVLKDLAHLLDLEIDGKPAIQIVLAGPPELEAKLDSPELASIRQRVVRWCELAPLARDEVAAYINCRLARTGCPSKNLFSTEVVAQVAAVSNGIPRLINIVCDNALLAAHSLGRSNVSQEIVDKVSHELGLTAEPGSLMITSYGAEKTAAHEIHPKSRNESVGRDALVTEPVSRPRRRQHRRFAMLRVTGFSAIFILAAGAVVYYSPPIDTSRLNDLAGVGSLAQIETRTDREAVPAEHMGNGSIQAATARSSGEFPSRTIAPPQPNSPEIQKPGHGSTKVFFHTSADRDRLILGEVGSALRIEGYVIPDTRISSSPTRGDVRFFFSQDRLAAGRVKSIVEAEFRRRGYRISLELLERDGKKFQFAAPGKIEVWIPSLANVLLARGP